MQEDKKAKLLPVGFYDLLFDEAKKSHQNINKVLDVFFDANYSLIKTPLVEFAENFSTKEMENSFRTTDVLSAKTLVFRNDITLQISRLLSTKLRQEDLPLRICYVGDVLCAKSEDLYSDRQQTQVGFEIIGCDQEKSNFEIVEKLLVALKKLNLPNLLIEVSLPDFLGIFLDEVVKNNKEELSQAILEKNISEIRNFAKENADIITKIALQNYDLENLFKEILSKFNSSKLASEIKRAQDILQFIKRNFSEIDVRFDIFGDQKSSYHNEISFDVFCGNFSYPIARGGRYKINNLNAIGATIYMNRLRKISLA